MAYTTGQAARLAGISATTTRVWTSDYGEFFSDLATPPPGGQRAYTDGDVALLLTIKELRSQQKEPAAIRAALEGGERVEFEGEDIPPGQGGAGDSAIVARMAATVARFEGELSAVREERDHLRGQLAELQTAHLQALERATRAETELSIVKGQGDREGQQGETKRPWWQFWR